MSDVIHRRFGRQTLCPRVVGCDTSDSVFGGVCLTVVCVVDSLNGRTASDGTQGHKYCSFTDILDIHLS